MKWQEIRQRYPGKWLLVEALKAHTEGNKRILENLSVIDAFVDGQDAMKAYSKLHGEEPQRELLVLHTDRVEPDVTVRHWLGIRSVP